MNRKTIRKMALIQWSCFQNEIAGMSGSTLFTGVNGSGKSTILDALSYLLTANTQFNVAAKDRERTVKGYVRGDTKSNGKDQYLRNGEVVSYLAVEVVSEMDGGTFVIGVCIESPSVADKCSSSWFILKNTVLSDVKMADEKDGRLLVYPRKQLTVKGKTLKMSDFMGRDKAKSQILRTLGLRCEPDKFRNKLVKMMAFNPENNVDQFIQNCVFEPGNINSLKELRMQKERFEDLRGIYNNLKISKEKLDIVEQRTNEYEYQNRMYLNRTLMLKYQEVLYSKDEKENIERRIKALEQRNAYIEEELVDTETKKQAAQDRYDHARNNRDFENVSLSIDAFNRQLDTLELQIKEEQKRVEDLVRLKEKIRDLKDHVGDDWTVSDEELHIFETMGDISYPAEVHQNAVQELEDILRKLKERYSGQAHAWSYEKTQIHKKLDEVLNALQELENRRVPYPAEAERVRHILQQELEKTHKNVQVRFFAELVQDIKDSAWRKAIETFLGRKRFYIIVDQECIRDALEILSTKKLHATNVVIADKIPETDIKKGSAAEMLTIPNASARKYANYLLNGIHLCDSIEELHEHPKGGLMKNGMLAKSYSAAMMDMSGTRCYMGSDAIELQMKGFQKEKAQLEEKEETYKENINEAEQKVRAIETADIRMRDYHFSAPMKLKNNEEEYQQIRADKQKLESDPGFMQILEEVNRSKALVDDLNKKTNQFIEKKGELKSEIKKENENLKEITGKIYTNQNQYEEFRSQHPELEQTMLADYDRFRQRSEDARVIKQKTVDNLRGDVDKAKNAMENAQLEYLRAAGISNLEMRGVSYISFYSKEKREISNVKIEEASNKLELYAREMESTFMTDFVNEMNESMKAAIEEKNMINDELKHLPFGNDTYTFTMDEREDRSEFFRICRKLNDYGSVEMLQSMNTEDEELSHDVRNFMDKILSEPDESEYTDYRRYYKYDMKIRTRRGNDEVEADFSKKQGSASNGEKQTPYFIILAASLMQCYPKGVECARIAFIDEAFAALSRERIEQMVKYLEENRFQVMYAAPPEKIASIGNLIDTTVSLVSSGRYTKMIEGLVSR